MTDLRDASGRTLAELLLDEAGGERWVVVQETFAPAGAVAAALLAAYGGHRAVTSDEALDQLLVDAGGVVRRRAHDYLYDLAGVPASWASADVPGVAFAPGLDPVAQAPVKDAANPPGHPDHQAGLDHEQDLRELLSGEVIGANVPDATWQAADDAGPCGGIVVSERRSPEHGLITWVLDVFVHPRVQGRGIGGALMRRSLAGAARAGYRATGLVVSDGNPARAVYEALGFRLTRSGSSIDLPG